MDQDELRAMAAVHPVAWAMHASDGQWKRAKHLMVLSEYLMQLWEGSIKRLAVSFPPRHGKSEMISKHFTTWWLGTRPTDRIVLASYGRDLTTQWTRDARDSFAEHAPAVFGLDTWTRSSVNNWHVFRDGKRTGGGMFGIGRGGGLTGRGADLLVCDDLVKDDAEARKQSQRDAIMGWFRTVALTRLSPGGRCIVIGTRFHHEDPIGQLEVAQAQEEGGEPWTFLNFPAVCEEENEFERALGREPGDALWPERFNVEALERTRADVGPYVWSALYMGRPTPVSGGMLRFREWAKYFNRIGDEITTEGADPLAYKALQLFAVADFACSTRTSADYTVVMVLGMHAPTARLFVLDVIRKRVEGPDIVPLLQRVHSQHNLMAIYAESGGFQLSIVQEGARAGLPIRECRPDKDKVSRAMPVTAAMESGRVFFPVTAHWLPMFESELSTFPHGSHDDQVDCIAYAVRVFNQVLFYRRQRAARGRDDGLGSLLGRL